MAVVLGTSTQDPVIVYVGVTQPSLYYQITSSVDGSLIDMTGATAVFFMRPLTSRSAVVDAAAVPLASPDNDGHNVRYDWQSSDVTIAGDYMGWFSYVVEGMSEPADTEEFAITITDHGPGFGYETGAVVDAVANWIPLTLDRIREEPTFGDRFLQSHADYVKQIVMGTVVTPDQEASYNPFLVQYLAKRVTLRLIPPARDYWGRQYRQVQSSGPAEFATFPDELQNLTNIAHQIACELPSDWLQLQAIVPGLPQLRREPMPLSSFGDPLNPWNRHVTPSPQESRRPTTGGPYASPWFEF